jgi:glycerol-3-phosphate dehydrogenase
MAEETVDLAVKTFELEDRVRSGCVTAKLRLVGSDGWSPNMFIGLVQRVSVSSMVSYCAVAYELAQYGIETEVAQYLARNYGDRAWTLLDLSESTGQRWPLHGIRLSPLYPNIEAEVRYSVRHEYAQTAVDFLARRSRLCFLNAQAALDSLPRVIEIMSAELGWSRARRKQEIERTTDFLESMGLSREVSEQRTQLMGWRAWASNMLFGSSTTRPSRVVYSRAHFQPGEIERLRQLFGSKASGDRLPTPQLLEMLQQVEEYQEFDPANVQSVLEQTGLDTRTDVGLDEFLEVSSQLSIRIGSNGPLRFVRP